MATRGHRSHRNLRLLLLSFYFPPMHDVGGLRASSFALHLPAHGIEVDAVVGATHESANQDLVDALRGTANTTRVESWFAGPLDCAWNAVRAGRRLASEHRYDLVLATGPPWATMKAGLVLSKLIDVPLVADFRDPWTSGALWKMHRGSYVSRWLHRSWEIAVLRHAAGIVCVHPAAVARIRANIAPRRHASVVCIPNGHDERPIVPLRAAGEDRCVFAHVGRLHPELRPPGIVLDALALACRDPGFAAEVLFLHVGAAPAIEDEVRARGLARQVVVEPPSALHRALRLMHGADVLVLINLATREADEVATAKIHDYLAARRPVLGIVRDGGASAGLLGEAGNATVCGIDDPARIAEAFLAMWRSWRRGGLVEHDLDLTRSSRRHRAAELAAFLHTLAPAAPRHGT